MEFGYGSKTRSEKVRFDLELDKVRAEKFQKELEVFPFTPFSEMQPGDSLKLKYEVYINYFGNVAQCLTALTTILSDPDVVVKAELTELKHGECLIDTVLARLRDVQEIIRKRAA